MIIPAGNYQLWPTFSLQLPQDLEISPDTNYYLQGNNGSGKSSFIKQLLLPKLRESECYHLYWEQQIGIQRYVISAHAAMHHQPFPARSELDALSYLAHNLKQAQSLNPRPAFWVLDECTRFEQLLKLIRELQLDISLVYSHHDGKLLTDNCLSICFTKVSSTSSIVNVSDN